MVHCSPHACLSASDANGIFPRQGGRWGSAHQSLSAGSYCLACCAPTSLDVSCHNRYDTRGLVHMESDSATFWKNAVLRGGGPGGGGAGGAPPAGAGGGGGGGGRG